MKHYHIINPAAGQGAGKKAYALTPDAETVLYETKGNGDARSYLAEVLKYEQDTCRVTVWGGDGTVGEAISGIMDARAAARTILSVQPTGTGNDLVRMFRGEAPGTEHKLDLLALDDGTYAVNMINIGFDCAVASRMAIWKKRPFVSGTLAYICGVLEVFFRPFGTEMTVSWTDEDGKTHTEQGKFLLCAIGNAQYCGGGFRGVPCASMSDGAADLMLVRVLPRLRFVGLIGKYRAGTHVKDGVPTPDCADVILYARCTSAVFTGMQEICRDGEIVQTPSLSFAVLPDVLRYEVL